jgi:hypothetical protein
MSNTPYLQREMAGRLPGPSTIVELDRRHLPAVAHAERLAELIVGAAARG